MSQLKLPAVIGSLREAVQYVDDLARAGGLPAVRAGRLRLAVEELVTNTIVHGYGDSRGAWQQLLLDSGVESDQVWVRIVDDAPPFDPTRCQPPRDLDSPLADRTPGGLGLYLAGQSVDRMTYEYSGGRNRVTLFMNRSNTR
ncbi:ATP-binding protein [Actinoplanes sp. NEAU-A12]|uniref:ATP-binding protein n=1 Tax=Actinoplanes sandaracinus TaxID=3045177 RepID=A0ABT6WL29_9ACTN|nr:ATP-binding protein [Actinoplanes sandaracinus]MDI6100433.1 ATP-binding protein [Actinoplanes sandaracinus]